MRISKKILSVLLAVMMLASTAAVTAFAASLKEETDAVAVAHFDSTGKFRIMQISDLEVTGAFGGATYNFIANSVKRYKPDLVIFSGDNTSATAANFKAAMQSLKNALNGTKFAFLFGRVDSAVSANMTRDAQYACVVNEYSAIMYDNGYADTDLPGVGTGCIPISDSTGTNLLWNLMLVDSGTRSDSGGYGKPGDNMSAPYANPAGYQAIVDWVEKANDTAKEYTSDKDYAPTLVFQHRALHEIYETGLLEKTTTADSDSVAAADKTGYSGRYTLSKSNPSVTGELKEPVPCSSESTMELYEAYAKHGNVKGVFCGDNHKNTFMGETSITQLGGTTYSLVQGVCPSANESLGPDKAPALRLFELYDDGTYVTDIVRYKSSDNGMSDKYMYVPNNGTQKYVVDIATGCAKKDADARNQLTQRGYTVIDFDLNKDAGGDYIHFGYKLGTDPSQAITAIRFQMGTKGIQNPATLTSKVNGKDCTFKQILNASSYTQNDLNTNAGGWYIYGYYTKDPCNGGITELIVDETEYKGGEYVDARRFDDINVVAELNKGCSGGKTVSAYIYTHYKVAGESVQFEHDCLEKLINQANILKNSLGTGASAELDAAITGGQQIIDSYALKNINSTYSSADIQAAMKAIRDAMKSLSTGALVTFDANGGSIATPSVSVRLIDGSATLDLTGYVPTTEQSDLTFAGWSTDRNASYGEMTSITITGNTTLYAIWSNASEVTSDDTNTEVGPDTNTETNPDTNSDNNGGLVIYGDVNCDGTVTMEDVTSLQKIIAQLTTHTSFGVNSRTNSDCNHDGFVNMEDVTTIQRYLAKLIPNLDP